MQEQVPQFRRSLVETLVRVLKSPPHDFSFSRFVEQRSVSRSVAEAAAEETFTRFCTRAAIDGVITDEEQSYICNLTELLEIPADKAEVLAARAKEAVYQEQYRKAQADGIITPEEDESLQQLRESLGLAPVAAAAGGASVSPQQPPPVAVSPSSFAPETFRRTLVYRASSPPAQIRGELAWLRELDKLAEGKQRFWMGMGCAAIIVGVLSLFVAFPVMVVMENPVLFVLPGLAVVSAIACFVMRAMRGRLNLDDRRYSLVSELARFLGTDMAPGSPLHVAIDFDSYHNERYCTGETGGGMFASTSAASYCLPWLLLKGSFADGNRFRLSATQVVKRKERRKRKYTKVKEAFREKISLTMLVKAKRYPRLDRIEGLMQGAQLPPGIQLGRVARNGNRVTIQALTGTHRRARGRGGHTVGKDAHQQTSSHHTMLGLFLACYHCLAQCRSRKGP